MIEADGRTFTPDMVLGADRRGLKVTYCTDTRPAYRRDVIPGATELSCLRLPQTEVGKFIDNEDSIYNYKSEELMAKRTEVEVNKQQPQPHRANGRPHAAEAARERATSR